MYIITARSQRWRWVAAVSFPRPRNLKNLIIVRWYEEKQHGGRAKTFSPCRSTEHLLPAGLYSASANTGIWQTHTHIHTHTCTRMHVHAVTISGLGVLESGRQLIMSECHIFMHECAVFMHADLVKFADMQTHTHTHFHLYREAAQTTLRSNTVLYSRQVWRQLNRQMLSRGCCPFSPLCFF